MTAEDGRILDEGRDLAALQADLGERARRDFMARQAEQWQRDGIGSFAGLELPEQVVTRTGHSAWPALVDQGNAAGLRLFDDEDEARVAHLGGVHRLMLIAVADKLKYIAKKHRLSRAAALAWTRVDDVARLEAALGRRVVWDLLGDAWMVRDAGAFKRLEDAIRPLLVDRCQKALEALDRTLLAWHRITRRLDQLGPAQPSTQADIASQLDDLMYADFVSDISSERLAHYPRYLDAIDLRLDALELDPRRDVQRQAEVEPWWQFYLDQLSRHGRYTVELDAYRWLIEEYRVQVFAQQLGTAVKVSKKRLQQARHTVEAPATA
ncbi:MAG: DUF3418 domain-containing protein [Xanthomonadaceae bacterium]|nr:DUF3418 domain-containing protein [Xanthomonadaceae bacterium]